MREVTIPLDEYTALQQAAQELKFAKEQIDYLIRQLYGRKSEKMVLDPNQMLLGFDPPAPAQEPAHTELQIEDVQAPRPRKARKRITDRLPENLPVETVVIMPPEVEANPKGYRLIGMDTTIELDVTPAKFIKREIIRLKFVPENDRQAPPIQAPAPKRIIENSFASVRLLVMIILGKYADHLPLYRQEMIFRIRYGIDLTRQTMSGWVWQIAHQLAMIYEALREEIRSAGYMQADETPVSYQEPGRGKCATGYLWAFLARDRGVLFEWFTSRSTDCLKAMLDDFSGILQSDGYAAYAGYFNRPGNAQRKTRVKLGGCWAHARRKFHEAHAESQLARAVLKELQALYRIETPLRRDGADHDTRLATRGARSVPILERINALLRNEQGKHLPQSRTGKAISYTLERWEQLMLFTRYGQMEIDNNHVENSIRPTAVGKKNWLFFGSAKAGQNSAIIYSLIETCRMLGINPEEYLTDILTQLPEMTNQTAHLYTPSKWKQARDACAPIPAAKD